MVVGENEEESPWEPLHVERGLSKEDSAITLFFANSYVNVLLYSADAKGVLNTVIYNIPPAKGGMVCVLVNPTCAKYLADEGWTKKEIERFIKEYARCPWDRHWQQTISILPKQLRPFNDTDSVPLIAGEDQVIVVVSGKFSSYVALAMGTQGTARTFLTQKVELPAKWEQLVKKYKDIVPIYARY